MIAALIYLQVHTLKNKVIGRVRRLQKPKYLAGAIVGGLYIYFFFIRRWVAGFSHTRNVGTAIPAEWLEVVEPLGTVLLFVIVIFNWILPSKRTALDFTEAEITFLFPAPVHRRTLIHFKLLKSQAAILVSAFFMTLFSGRLGSGSSALFYAAGWWLLLSTLNLHFLCASFVRTRLLDRGVSNWQRRGILAGLLVLLVGITVWWGQHSLTTPVMEDFTSLKRAAEYVQTSLATGPLFYLLYPFRWLVRPLLAQNAPAFLLTLGPALAMLALHYWWAMRSDVAFEEASVEASRKRAELLAAVRAGKLGLAPKSKRRKQPPFQLHPTGPRFVALIWKNLIAAGQMFTLRLWLLLAILAVVPAVVMATIGVNTPLLPIIGFFALLFGGMSLVLGPQVMRVDLRQDLPLADILKMYPLPGWQVVLGEVMAPTVILTGMQWLVLILAIGTLANLPEATALALPYRLSIGLAVAMIVPLLNLISLLILNAAVLMFPAWIQFGPTAARGVEVMGQQMIVMAGQILVVILALLPAAILFTILFFVGAHFVGVVVTVPLAAAAAAVLLAIEAGLGVHLLGRLFERFDLSAEATV